MTPGGVRPSAQVPAIYHRRLGDLVVTALSDGYVDLPLDALQGINSAEATRMVAVQTGSAGLRTSVTMFALRSGRGTVLVDAGSGSTMGPTCGRLPENLALAGIDPAEVDAVLLTHVHPDHAGGLTDDDGRALFPRAEIVVHERDIAHWFDDAAMAVATERARTRYFAGARFRLAPYRDRIRTFHDGEVLPGIVGVPCPGHTPGHCAFRVASGGDEVLIWGDTVHVPELQVPRPEVTMMFDADPPLAATSRCAIFDLAIDEGLVVAGMHLHFPGFARMAKRDGTYTVLPEPWAYTV